MSSHGIQKNKMLEKIFPFLNGINDLTNTHYVYRLLLKNNFISGNILNFYMPWIMGGRNVSGDPLNGFFYPPNWIYIFINFNTATILNILLHFCLMFFGTCVLLKKYFHLKSLFFIFSLSFIFSLWPKWFWHLYAGHIDLYQVFSWLPLMTYFVFKFLEKQYIFSVRKTIIFTAICVFSFFANYFFFLHIVIFLPIFILLALIFQKQIQKKELFKTFSLFTVIFLLFASLQIIPAANYVLSTGRITISPADILPVWSYKNIIVNMFLPSRNFVVIDQEQFIFVGVLFSLISFFGFFNSSFKFKKELIIIFTFFSLIVFNFKTPVFYLIKAIPGFSIFRVTSRFWIFCYLIMFIFFVFKITKIKKSIAAILIVLILVNYAYFDVVKITSLSQFGEIKKSAIYDYLERSYPDKKIYETGAILSQFLLAKKDLVLVGGESPLQDKKYILKLKKAGGFEWFNNYAVIYPPYQAENARSQPNAKLLCEINAEIVLSKYKLTDKRFKYLGEIDKINIYENPCVEH